jgi:hypothetical protein
MDKKIKVLFLDADQFFLPSSEMLGAELEVITFGCKDVYSEPSTKDCVEIMKITSNKEVDLVVIGNNLGSGVTRAMFVNEAMKEKTIIVWNNYSPLLGVENCYKNMGFANFVSRGCLRCKVCELFGVDLPQKNNR